MTQGRLARLAQQAWVGLILLLAFLAFVGAAIGWRYRKINLIAVGLALWVLTNIVA